MSKLNQHERDIFHLEKEVTKLKTEPEAIAAASPVENFHAELTELIQARRENVSLKDQVDRLTTRLSRLRSLYELARLMHYEEISQRYVLPLYRLRTLRPDYAQEVEALVKELTTNAAT